MIEDAQAHLRAAVRRRRWALGLSQQHLADLLGMHRVSYQRLESGTRHVMFEEIALLSEVLNFPIEDLLGPDAARSYKAIVNRIVRREP